jgi:serine O-acetyltransferase
MFRNVVADLRSTVHSNYTGIQFWGRVIGKGLFAPNVHVVLLYRLSVVLYRFLPSRPLAFLVRSMTVVWGGTEIHPATSIGPGLFLVHSHKVVIGPGVRIGSNARIGHGVTIAGDTGQVGTRSKVGIPVLGDDVTVALDSIVLGPVTVGDGAFIGAQSLVLHDVPARSVVRGSPAAVVRYLDETPADDPADDPADNPAGEPA